MSCVSVQEGYARWAPSYDLGPNPLLALEERHLSPMLATVAGARVLDLGCGTGRWSTWLIQVGAGLVVGLDFSRAMVGEANKKRDLRGRLVLADGLDLPFRNASFDIVMCSFVLGHVRDLELIVREIGRVTVANGRVYATDLHPDASARGWKTAARDRDGAWEITTWPRSSEQQLAAWCAAGFHCAVSTTARIGEPERPILDQAGKAPGFEEIRQVPAVQIFCFKRNAK